MPAPYYFLSTRTDPHGGPVAASVSVFLGPNGSSTAAVAQAVRGSDVLFVTHGFNVNQPNGINHLTCWMDALDAQGFVTVGILWPGDCFIPMFVDYVVEGHEAIHSGDLLARFIASNLQPASVSFVSHSLGARLVLQTIQGLPKSWRVKRAVLMAGAIDDDCLTNEYQAAANVVEEISVLASQEDFVLAAAFPLANPLQGIIDRGSPYWKAAIGRDGPNPPQTPPNGLQANFEIPSPLNYGHLDYLPGGVLTKTFPSGEDLPVTLIQSTGSGPVPAHTPAAVQNNAAQWKPAWSAGFTSTRVNKA